MSGKLVTIKQQDCANTVWGTAAVSSCIITIHFMHRFVHAFVNFEVTQLACMQFDVRVLEERRLPCLTEMQLRRLTNEEGWLHNMLNTPLTGTKHAVGRIPFVELLDGVGGKAARKS